MGKKVALHNLGCKVNAYEVEAMQQLLEEAGYEIVPFEPGADVYLINTCTVTNIADRKSRQMLHKAKKMNPHAIVVAAGCYVQAAGTELEEDSAIDIIIGNNRKKDLASILEHYERSAVQESLIDINHTKEYEKLSLEKTVEHTRAYLKVQDGCNQFCSYCIIPYARGRVRSRRKEEVVEEVKTLAGNGCKEVVLTGIHWSSYGIDHGSTLQELILAVHEVAGVERIRLGSLEPGIITEDFVKTLSALPKFCPHFHLSLQSGCDATLKRMNRRYTSGEYYEKCILIRKYFKHPALTTDVIVGFPGETEEEFAITRDFLNKVDFYETHIFQYSRRKGTKAAVMENQVPEDVVKDRFSRLLTLVQEKGRENSSRFQGTIQEILVEDENREKGTLTGRTQHNLLVHFPGEKNLIGKYVKVSLDTCKGFYYFGHIVEE
mgnify:CR=1 FL=1